MWRQCLPEAVLKVTNLDPTRAKTSPHPLGNAAQTCLEVIAIFSRKTQGYCMMPQPQCLNRKAEGCMLGSSDPSHSAHPQALKGRENNTGLILLHHLLTSACSTAPTAPSSHLLILLQGFLAEKGRGKKEGF